MLSCAYLLPHNTFVYEVAVRPQLQLIFFSKCFENSVSLFEIKRFCGTLTAGFKLPY